MVSDGTAAVVSALQKNPHCRLRVLTLRGCGMDPQTESALARTMKRIALERLEVSCCSLPDDGMATLAAGLGHSRSLQHLNVSNNKFSAAGAAALAAAIGACPALTSLNVSNRVVAGKSIGDAGLAALAPALLNVRTLKLNYCGLTLQCAAALAGLIRDSRALESLHVSMNQLGARGVAVLAAALQPSVSLRTLHAQGCDAGADGVIALADALRRGWRASDLRLDLDPSIGDSGALALAAALEQLGDRCTLATLSLNDCGITAAGALALVRAATAAPSLRYLNCSHNYPIKAADEPALIAACGPQPQFELRLSNFWA
jgi:Ran GTPase-activating protein (RanGAP) involved in mRNA processing and transport